MGHEFAFSAVLLGFTPIGHVFSLCLCLCGGDEERGGKLVVVMVVVCVLWERGGCWSRRNHAAKNDFDASFAGLPSDRCQVEKKPPKFIRELTPENFSSIQNARQLSADNPETPSVCTFKTPQFVPSRTLHNFCQPGLAQARGSDSKKKGKVRSTLHNFCQLGQAPARGSDPKKRKVRSTLHNFCQLSLAPARSSLVFFRLEKKRPARPSFQSIN